jgi:hypothetical protein
MRTLSRRTVVVGLLALLAPLGAVLAQTHPLVGTWKLNPAKSTAEGAGTVPKSLTVTYEQKGKSFTLTAKGENADGTPINATYTTEFDAKPVATKGGTGWDHVAVKRLDAHTVHTSRLMGGKEVQTVHAVLAADGKSYTSTTMGVNAKGEKIKTVFWMDKQ